MMQRLAGLPTGQRLMIFGFIAVGGLALLIGVTVLLSLLTVNTSPRSVAVPIAEGVTVTEYAALPGDDAYPAALVAAPDGTVYTASYSSGEVFIISANGTVSPIPNTRDTFGSVAGLVYDDDTQTLMVLDRTAGTDSTVSGATFYRLSPDGQIELTSRLTRERGTLAFNGLARDAQGYLYSADLLGAVWRFDPDGGNAAKWWEAPRTAGADAPVITDVAYDPTADALYASDSRGNTLYRLDPQSGAGDLIYQFTGTQNPPGLAGLTIGADGTLYVTALDEKALMTLREGQLVYLAGLFRGPWDAAILPDGRVLVSNIDSRALATPGVSPQLPFGIDVVALP
jgi:DNA-binding beta-propeller fold protein YncE